MPDTVLLVGCGNMGYAMLRGWLESDTPPDVLVVEPAEALRARAEALGATVYATAEDLPEISPVLIFLAVKPQVMADVVPAYGRFAGGPATFLSVAAGTTIATLASLLPGPTPIIRSMPNTPACVGAGMIVCCADGRTTTNAKERATQLLTASGVVEWVEDEALMDAVTALSGSGPAYVFHMIECMTAAGLSVGLPEHLAAKMAMQTVMGAGRYAGLAEDPPGRLRQQVTSPGGTTAAALNVLMSDDRLLGLITEAVKAARDRSRELGGS